MPRRRSTSSGASRTPASGSSVTSAAVAAESSASCHLTPAALGPARHWRRSALRGSFVGSRAWRAPRAAAGSGSRHSSSSRSSLVAVVAYSLVVVGCHRSVRSLRAHCGPRRHRGEASGAPPAAAPPVSRRDACTRRLLCIVRPIARPPLARPLPRCVALARDARRGSRATAPTPARRAGFLRLGHPRPARGRRPGRPTGSTTPSASRQRLVRFSLPGPGATRSPPARHWGLSVGVVAVRLPRVVPYVGLGARAVRRVPDAIWWTPSVEGRLGVSQIAASLARSTSKGPRTPLPSATTASSGIVTVGGRVVGFDQARRRPRFCVAHPAERRQGRSRAHRTAKSSGRRNVSPSPAARYVRAIAGRRRAATQMHGRRRSRRSVRRGSGAGASAATWRRSDGRRRRCAREGGHGRDPRGPATSGAVAPCVGTGISGGHQRRARAARPSAVNGGSAAVMQTCQRGQASIPARFARALTQHDGAGSFDQLVEHHRARCGSTGADASSVVRERGRCGHQVGGAGAEDRVSPSRWSFAVSVMKNCPPLGVGPVVGHAELAGAAVALTFSSGIS